MRGVQAAVALLRLPCFGAQLALLSAAFLWSVNLAFAGSPFPTTAVVKTSDGVSLQASYGQPAKASTNGVVFVPGSGRSKEDWVGVADACWRSGSWVVAVDLRGMGANVPAGSTPVVATPDDYQRMAEDVKAAVAFLKSRGVTKVALVGAELGANLAINVAADDAMVVDVVLLSPGLEQKGIIATDAVKRYGARPLLLVASQDDSYGALSVGRLEGLAVGEKRLEMFEAAGRGTRMLNRAPELEGIVVGWINTHWIPRAVPSPAR